MGIHETSEKSHRKAILLTFYQGVSMPHTQHNNTSCSTENEGMRRHHREKIFPEEHTNNTYSMILRQNLILNISSQEKCKILYSIFVKRWGQVFAMDLDRCTWRKEYLYRVMHILEQEIVDWRTRIFSLPWPHLIISWCHNVIEQIFNLS